MKIRRSLSHLYDAKITSHTPLMIDPTEHADLLFGVGSATSAGPTLPSGSIHPSPETLEKDNGGYLRDQPIIGFGQAYVSGSGGVKCYGNFLLAPMTESFVPDGAKRASLAVKDSERAKCYEYSVKLENGISARLSPDHSSAIYCFDYPAKAPAFLYIDVAHKLDTDACLLQGELRIDPEGRSVCGGGLCTGNLNKINWNMYFALEFDSPVSEIGVLRGDVITKIGTDCEYHTDALPSQRLGAYLRFKDGVSGVKVKIAISFVSIEKAKEHLASQIPDFDYEAVKARAREKWREVLSAVEPVTDDKELLRHFYTAMYHMNIQPRNRSDDHGTWDDFHTIWDSWKTLFPMYSLIYPERMGRIVDSMLSRADKNKAESKGIVISDAYMAGKEYLAGQGGNDVENVIADAYLKGITLKDHSWEDAYRILRDSAENMRSPEYLTIGRATKNATTASGVPYSWRFKPAAATLGFAFNDKAVATVARELGTPKEKEGYEKRSLNWKNVWNSNIESEGFFGFPQNPEPDSSFSDDFDAHGGYNTHFYEATAWDASYINYNDVPSLVEAMGGKATFCERLLWACEHSVNYYNDDHGKEGYLNFTNEPSFHIPWLFCTDEIKRPDLASRVIDRVIKRFSLANDYPGDEDNGGMSSYYLFLMSGFFPYATTDYYYLHGTRMDKIIFRLGNGRELIIKGVNAGGRNIYVQSASFNGRELNSCKLSHGELLEGGELCFVMGEHPSNWARED